MAETGIVRFPAGNLDPRAEEFRPRNPNQAVILFRPPPPPPQTVYYPYVPPAVAMSEVQVVPLGYEQFPAAYVGASVVASAVATRAVALSSVGGEASETSLRRELELFGEVRAVQMERLRSEGIVTVHFYDLRHAQDALAEIRHQHMLQQTRLRNHYYASLVVTPAVLPEETTASLNWAADTRAPPFAVLPGPPPPPARGLVSGRAVWAQFVVPASNAVPEGHNQGTLVIFNLDSDVTVSTLRDIFQPFGPIKEFRETPAKKHQKFVEFFDVRDAAKALKEMNGKEVHGKPLVIEFSRPGGHSRKFLVNSATPLTNPAISNNNHCNTTPIRTTPTTSFHNKFFPVPPNMPPRKLSGGAHNHCISPRAYSASQGKAQFPVRSKSSFFAKNGNKTASTTTRSSTSSSSSALSCVEQKMASSLSLCNETSITAEPARRTTTTTSFSKKNTGPTTNYQSPATAGQGRSGSGGTGTGARHKKSKQGKKLDTRFLISEDALTTTTTESSGSCRDNRTTVMIKNIPNKYSQKLLLNMLDNHCIHCNKRISDGGEAQPLSSYDFVYLPIDFNNKCNVGYGFVNMTSPEATWRLYKAFHLQLWEAFNSRKICEVTYARVQGLEALKEHFKNSKFPCEMEHYLPVVFSPPRDGRQLTEPLPIVGQPTTKPNLAATPPPSSSSSDDHDRDGDENMDGGDQGDEGQPRLCENGCVAIIIDGHDDDDDDRD